MEERNFQIDEAYLLLGKARYYDQRFIPALDAIIFYINTQTVAISMKLRFGVEKNMRLGSDALVVNNMTTLLKDQDLKNRLLLNALLSEAY
jgi:hypothetical protein